MLKDGRERHSRASAKLVELDRMLDEVNQRVADAGVEGDPEIVVLLQEARSSADGVEAQVWLRDDTDDDADQGDSVQLSRYERRSAGLPHLGDEASSKLLSEMSSLRRSESDGKPRRRRSK
jgi:uncharacterized protein YcbX